MSGVFASLYEMGVPFFLLSLAQPFLSTFIMYWYMQKLLPNRLNVYLLVGISFVYALWYVLGAPNLFGTGYHLVMNVFINMFTISILVFVFQGKYWKKLMVWWYFETIKAICETVAFVPVLLYRSRHGFYSEWVETISAVEGNPLLKLLYMLTFLSLFLLLAFLSIRIWYRLLLQKFQPFYLLFILLPMGYKYSLALVIHPGMGDWFFGVLINFMDDLAKIYLVFGVLGILTCLLADIAILYYVLSHEKRAKMEAELQESKRMMELEQARFAEVEKKSEELARIRHDLNNQLMSVIQLVQVGENAAAKEMVDALTGEINRDTGDWD